ncbi:MAG: transcription antitermination factor NusB [Termitinemataceae bacterium]|nr:MAG: transcription antitermination factor NusB [Termitinemataceae bacterium]
MSRSKGRVLAFQAIYAWEACAKAQKETGKVTDIQNDLCGFEWEDQQTLSKLADSDLDFARLLIAGTIENIEQIDGIIKSLLVNWDFSRLKRVDLAVLRMSIYSLLFQKDIPASVVIEESVKICIDYGTDESFKFVNALLDNVNKSRSSS